MSLTLSDVDRIAQLSRLRLHDDERQQMLDKLNGFFGLVAAMQAVDTTGVQAMAHPLAAVQDVQLRLREDKAVEPNRREANQQSAPSVERGLFLVPKVIE